MARLVPVDYDPFANNPSVMADNPFGKDAATFEKIKLAESSGNSKAINRNKNGTYDSGLYQINSMHIPELQKQGIIQNPNDLFNPEINTKAAAFLYQRDGLQPWSASKEKWDKPILTPVDYDPFAKEEKPIVKQSEAPQKPTMFSKMGDALSQRAEEIRKINQFATTGTNEDYRNSLGYALKTLAQIGGGVGDVTGSLLSEYISRASGYKYLPEPIKDKISALITQSAPARAVGGTLGEIKERHPIGYSMVMDTLDTMNLFPTGWISSKGAGTLASIAGESLGKKISNDVVKYVKKDISRMGREGTELVKKGQATAKITSDGKIKKVELKTTPEHIEMGKAVEDVVDPRGNPYKNVDNIREKIKQRSYEVDNVILNKDANSIFIGEKGKLLFDKLDDIKNSSTRIFGSNEGLRKAYDDVIDLFKEEFAKQPNNLSGLYNARKKLGTRIRETFGEKKLLNDPTDNVRELAEQSIYKVVPDFISDTLPEGNQFKRLLKDEALMYKAIDTIAFNNPPKVLTKGLISKITGFGHQHPFAIAAGLGGTGFATGILTAPAVMGGLAAYGTYKIGKKVITSTAVRKELAKVLRGAGTVLTGNEKKEIGDVIKFLDDSERVRGRKAIGPGNPEVGASGGPAIPIEKTPMRGTETGRMGVHGAEPPLTPQPSLRDWNPYAVTEGIGIPSRSKAQINRQRLIESITGKRVFPPEPPLQRSQKTFKYAPEDVIDITPTEQAIVKPRKKRR